MENPLQSYGVSPAVWDTRHCTCPKLILAK